MGLFEGPLVGEVEGVKVGDNVFVVGLCEGDVDGKLVG